MCMRTAILDIKANIICFCLHTARLALAVRQFAVGEFEFKLAKDYVEKCFRISQTG